MYRSPTIWNGLDDAGVVEPCPHGIVAGKRSNIGSAHIMQTTSWQISRVEAGGVIRRRSI